MRKKYKFAQSIQSLYRASLSMFCSSKTGR